MRDTDGDVKSARRTVAFLELLLQQEDGAGLSLTELSARTAVPKGSTHALLQTLVATGLVRRTPANTYELSSRWLALMGAAASRASLDSASLRQAVASSLRDLSESLGMTCNLAVLGGSGIVYVDKVESAAAAIRLSTTVGASLPAHATAAGKALLASLEPADREAWAESHDLEPITPYTTTTVADLLTDLEECGRRGYAVELEECRVGVIGIAATVFDGGGRPAAAISVLDLSPTITALGIEAVGEKVRAAADVASGLTAAPAAG